MTVKQALDAIVDKFAEDVGYTPPELLSMRIDELRERLQQFAQPVQRLYDGAVMASSAMQYPDDRGNLRRAASMLQSGVDLAKNAGIA